MICKQTDSTNVSIMYDMRVTVMTFKFTSMILGKQWMRKNMGAEKSGRNIRLYEHEQHIILWLIRQKILTSVNEELVLVDV
jgi:hypothetical protein